MSHLRLAIGVSLFAATGGSTADWPTYGNDPGGMRYSPLTQIDRDNVTKLRVAWTYHTGDVADGSQTPVRSAFEATPIVVDRDFVGVLAVVVEMAAGTKCARSWKILPTVGDDPEYPDVSPRDAQALREWKALRVSV